MKAPTANMTDTVANNKTFSRFVSGMTAKKIYVVTNFLIKCTESIKPVH